MDKGWGPGHDVMGRVESDRNILDPILKSSQIIESEMEIGLEFDGH